MKTLALIVEDEAGFQELLQERMLQLDHTCHLAPSQQAAQALLDRHNFDYVLLDLCIPFRTGQGVPLSDNGEALLEQIVAHPRQKGVPVIIWTSHGLGTYVLATRLMSKGAFYFLGKDSEALGVKLNDVIRSALARKSEKPLNAPVAEETAKPEPVSPPKGNIVNEMVFYPDRIELWGFRIYDAVDSSQLRDVLDLLRVVSPVSGARAARLLGTDGGQNVVSQCVRRIRIELKKRFAASSRWPCPPEKVVLSRGVGFRINPEIKLVDRLGTVVPQVVARASAERRPH
jgi:CheY-like chemotaxis protein